MKDYFNAKEQAQHLAILACQGKAKQLREAKSLKTNEPVCSKYERMCLKYAETYLTKFTVSAFKRMGEPYKRKLLATLDCNRLELVGKHAPETRAITECASEDLQKGLATVNAIVCTACQNKEHTQCGIYAMFVAVGLEAKQESGCPFRTNDFDAWGDEEDLGYEK